MVKTVFLLRFIQYRPTVTSHNVFVYLLYIPVILYFIRFSLSTDITKGSHSIAGKGEEILIIFQDQHYGIKFK